MEGIGCMRMKRGDKEIKVEGEEGGTYRLTQISRKRNGQLQAKFLAPMPLLFPAKSAHCRHTAVRG